MLRCSSVRQNVAQIKHHKIGRFQHIHSTAKNKICKIIRYRYSLTFLYKLFCVAILCFSLAQSLKLLLNMHNAYTSNMPREMASKMYNIKVTANRCFTYQYVWDESTTGPHLVVCTPDADKCCRECSERKRSHRVLLIGRWAEPERWRHCIWHKLPAPVNILACFLIRLIAIRWKAY